jgi:hypothetical protein
MNRFVARLTRLFANRPTENPRPLPVTLVWLLVILALVAYLLPWVVNTSAGLTLGAYDLAEWAGHHPDVHASGIGATSLLLRLQPALLAFVITLAAPSPRGSRGWWVSMLFAGMIAAALLPPLEYFSSMRGDGNYQQMFGIVIVTLLGSAAVLTGLFMPIRLPVLLAVVLIGIITSAVGLMQASDLMRQFNLTVQFGAGAALFFACYLALGLIFITGQVSQTKQGSAQVRAALSS